jgi:hypothetical protein
MLFMCTSTWDPGHANDAIKKRLEVEKKGDVVPPGVKVVGEWGYVGGGKAFFLAEVDDPSAFMGMCMQWADVMSLDVVPVLERKDIKKLRSRTK